MGKLGWRPIKILQRAFIRNDLLPTLKHCSFHVSRPFQQIDDGPDSKLYFSINHLAVINFEAFQINQKSFFMICDL